MSKNAKAAGILATTLVAPVLIAIGIVQINNANVDPNVTATGNEGALPIIAGLVVLIAGIVMWVTNRKA